jgi:hypothetical protein
MRTPLLASIAAALVLSMGLVLAAPALAQTAGAAAPAKKKKSGKKGPAAAAGATPAAADKASAKGKKGSKKKGKKGEQAEQAAKPTDDLAPPPSAPVPVAPAPTATTVIIKTPAAPVAPAPEELSPGQYDDDPPLIAHAQIKQALHNKPLVFTAHITDPSGVFQPVLYLRKRGTGDYLPIKLIASKAMQGDYAVEVDAKLISVELEYYIECYDNAGNGPARVGSPENPFEIALEEEKKVVPLNGQVVVERHPGAPPAISHQTISKAIKGQNIEIPAKLVGDTGVSQAQVFFRHAGEHDFHGFPMGSVGGDDYSATIPASAVSGDLEYYLEAYDKYGNGPGRSGGPMVPYQISVSEAPPPPLIVTTPNQPIAEKKPELPRLVKVPFSANPGRAAGWLFMAGFIATTAFAGGELYGAYNADQAYQHAYTYDGRLDQDVHQSSLDDEKRARIFGLVAGGSLVVSIALLLIFPEHPDTQIVAPNGDIAVARF